MKKKILIGVLGVAATVVANGQGQINFNNYWSEAQTTGVTYGNGPDAGLGVGPEISAILLWGASTDTSISQLTAVAGSETPFGMTVATGPGPISTGAGIFTHLGALSINGGTAGNFAFAIEATGTLNGLVYTGFSPVAVGPTQPTSASPIPNLPTVLRQGSFIVIAPEPSILALSGIGAGALMLVRRRAASK